MISSPQPGLKIYLGTGVYLPVAGAHGDLLRQLQARKQTLIILPIVYPSLLLIPMLLLSHGSSCTGIHTLYSVLYRVCGLVTEHN